MTPPSSPTSWRDCSARLDDVMLRVIAFQKLQGMDSEEIAASLEVSTADRGPQARPDPRDLGGGIRMHPRLTPTRACRSPRCSGSTRRATGSRPPGGRGGRPDLGAYLLELDGAPARVCSASCWISSWISGPMIDELPDPLPLP